MLPKERVKTAMDLGKPDRVPLMCQFSIGHMLLQLKNSPAEFWFDCNEFAKGLLKIRNMYDFDGILISLHGHDPDWHRNVKSIEKYDEGEKVEWLNGDITYCVYNDLPYFEKKNKKTLPELSEVTENDLPETLTYIPVSQNLHFEIHPKHKFDVIEKIVKEAGDKYSIHGEITSPFDYLLDFAGIENSLVGLLLEPEKSKMILYHFACLVKNLAVEMCDTGIDAIKISSPFAGSGFISPDHYSEFVLPYEKEIAEAIRAKGVHVYTHTCGKINDRLELMFDCGISGIECLDPPPMGDVELTEALDRVEGKGFIKGNIDSVNTLLFGNTQKVKEDAVERIKNGKNHKGFILSTACSIAPAVPKENILLLKEAVEQYGYYNN